MDDILLSENEFVLDKPFTREEIKVADEQILQSFKCQICFELVWNPLSCYITFYNFNKFFLYFLK